MYKREKIKVRVLNQSLHRANIAKNDEFYTQLTDIEKELRHYKEHLKNKVIFLFRPQNIYDYISFRSLMDIANEYIFIPLIIKKS